MNHRKLVLPEHMNQQGALFGGYLLKWLDEFAWITAQLDYPKCRFVTRSLDGVSFKHPISCGEILNFQVTRNHTGDTSVQYHVEVLGAKEDLVFFETHITFVNISEPGQRARIEV